MLKIPGSAVEIPARALATKPTRDARAWLQMHLTVELHRPVEAMRVSTNRSSLAGDWYAIGDWVHSRSGYVQSYALPPKGNAIRAAFAFQAIALLEPEAILNVGVCGPLFDQPGGGVQAEFLEGPAPKLRVVDGTWVDYFGHA